MPQEKYSNEAKQAFIEDAQNGDDFVEKIEKLFGVKLSTA